MDFKGKIAVVTGGASGIGKSCCLSLAEKGATVIAVDRNENGAKAVADEIKQKGGNAEGLSLDIVNIAQIKVIVDYIENKYSRIDILINCAGITDVITIEDITETEWDRMLEIDLKGPFFVSQAVINVMKKNNFGKIVNLGSVAGEVGGIVVGANYVAAKAGIIGLTKSLAKSAAKYGINVNTVSPGFIDTEMTKDLNQDVRMVPLGRKGTSEEVSDVILFLCSDYARYLTGVNLDVNGGLHMN
ncbi:SDR family oxidoreductase [Sedimentibacter hydroxybenzoicus DSM 7310]|uniref:SDR family oxidoreductase n=1 Tax=Sedimentibacter hydroxybenzoicus DSM 7310 TaxID=1123245 RepID=A0A974BH50_SEDHY|nr:SDR family NAD(P)-dependent oxidoreductase [Sedimentibacter hydroxybenzoicus]NYB72752.1 SDR family oxidoreductase [Sedimentibacter hydroxybenzoicus DSM 7310]